MSKKIPEGIRNRAIYKTLPKDKKQKPDIITQIMGEESAAEYKKQVAEQEKAEPEDTNTKVVSIDSQPKKDKRSLNAAKNPIINDMKKLSETQKDNKQTIGDLLELYDLDPINTAEPEAIAERMRFYFNWCSEKAIRPGVEGLAMALGTTRGTLNRWEHGECGALKRDLVKKAKQFIANYLEILAQSGKINPVTFIFLTKNNHGYQDKTDININVESPLGDTVSPKDIEQRLPDAKDIIDADFKEL